MEVRPMPARPLRIRRDATLDCNAGSAWEVLGAWDGLVAYAGGVVGCEATDAAPGSIRRVTLADGTHFTERLVAMDAMAMTYSYEFADAPAAFPIIDYVARVTVAGAEPDRCVATFEGQFRPRTGKTTAEAVAFVDSAYSANLDGLRALLAKRTEG
jgi:hypothetical protein